MDVAEATGVAAAGLTIRGRRRSQVRRRLVDQVTFRAAAGSIVGIVGPVGPAASVLLATLAGERRPDGGTVRIAGRDPYARDEDQRDLVLYLSPTEPRRRGSWTVATVLKHGAKRRLPRDLTAADRRARVAEILRLPPVARLVGRPIKGLSGLNQWSTMLTLLHLTPPVLLAVDNPDTLDSAAAGALMARLRDFADGGGTVMVVVARDKDVNGCDELLILSPTGSVAYLGPPAGARTRYGAANSAELLGKIILGPDFTGTD